MRDYTIGVEMTKWDRETTRTRNEIEWSMYHTYKGKHKYAYQAIVLKDGRIVSSSFNDIESAFTGLAKAGWQVLACRKVVV